MKTNKDQDGLTGTVKSVHVEVVNIFKKGDKWFAGRRKPSATIIYDKQGNRTSERYHEIVFGPSLSERQVAEYDIDGNVIECLSYYDGVLQNRKIISYDRGKKIGEKAYGADGVLIHKTSYKYDAHGVVTEMISFNADNVLIDRHAYANEYDSVGNWTKMTVRRWTNMNGRLFYQPLSEIYRTITYYP